MFDQDALTAVLQYVTNIPVARATCTTWFRVIGAAKLPRHFRASVTKFNRSPLYPDTRLTSMLRSLQREADVYRLASIYLSDLATINGGIAVGLDFHPHHAAAFELLAQRCEHLETLNLEDSAIRITAIAPVIRTFMAQPTLRTLRLSGNRFSSRAFSRLCAPGTGAPPSAVTALHLADLGLYDDAAALGLLSFLQLFPALTALNINENAFGESFEIVAGALAAVPRLQTLMMSNSDCNAADLALLAAGLASGPDLAELHVQQASGVEANLEGAAAIMQVASLNACFRALASNNLRLTDIDLATVFIGGGTDIARLFAALPELARLTLSSCNLQNEGALSFADHLHAYPALEALNLSTNDISAFGARALADGLARCSTLTRLDLRSNWAGEHSRRALAAACHDRVEILI